MSITYLLAKNDKVIVKLNKKHSLVDVLKKHDRFELTKESTVAVYFITKDSMEIHQVADIIDNISALMTLKNVYSECLNYIFKGGF